MEYDNDYDNDYPDDFEAFNSYDAFGGEPVDLMPSNASGASGPITGDITIGSELPQLSVTESMYRFETLPSCTPEDRAEIDKLPISLYNATAAFRLGCSPDLRTLSIRIKGCEYTPPGTNARLRTVNPVGVASIGPSGYVHLTGCADLEKARECAGLIVAIVRAAGYPQAKCYGFRICTLLASVRLPYGVNLNKVASCLALSSYEPEVFPSLQYRMILEPNSPGNSLPTPVKINISVMSNGACNITGVNCIEQVRFCVTKIYALLKMHSIPLTAGQREQILSGNILSTHARATLNRRIRLCRNGVCSETGDELNPETLQRMAENERQNLEDGPEGGSRRAIHMNTSASLETSEAKSTKSLPVSEKATTLTNSNNNTTIKERSRQGRTLPKLIDDYITEEEQETQQERQTMTYSRK